MPQRWGVHKRVEELGVSAHNSDLLRSTARSKATRPLAEPPLHLLLQMAHVFDHLVKRGGSKDPLPASFECRSPTPPSRPTSAPQPKGVMTGSMLLHTPQRVQALQLPRDDPVISFLAANDAAGFQGQFLQRGMDANALYLWAEGETLCLRTLAHLAALHSATDVLAVLLLELGADARIASPDDGFTALHCACSRPTSLTTSILRLLLNAGADLEAQDKQGRTARDLLSLQAPQVGRSGVGARVAAFMAGDRPGLQHAPSGPCRRAFLTLRSWTEPTSRTSSACSASRCNAQSWRFG